MFVFSTLYIQIEKIVNRRSVETDGGLDGLMETILIDKLVSR